jgi:protein-S-isoprenylcysteine O-methyltransferase Ste14
MARYAKLAARLRVPSGFLIVALYIVAARPQPASVAAGLPLAAGGLLLRGWAAGHLAKNRKLTTSGPFACTRNPLYLGTLLVAAGFGLASWNPWLAALLGAYFGLVYWPVIGEEENHLRTIFPDYAAYEAQVPRFWPRFTGRSQRGAFQWALYRYNREYQALAGYLAAAAVLLWKLL